MSYEDTLEKVIIRLDREEKEKDRRIAELENQWISVEDRLPKRSVFVLIYRPEAVFDKHKISRISHGCFEGIEIVTHWMPLPQPPNKALKEQKHTSSEGDFWSELEEELKEQGDE